MKLVAFASADASTGAAPPAASRAGFLTERGVHDLAPAGVTDLGAWIAGGARAHLSAAADPVEATSVGILAPLPRPGKIICVGLNCADHCREQGIRPPDRQWLRAKGSNGFAPIGPVMGCEIEGIGALHNPVADELPRTDDHADAAGVAELLAE